MSAVIPVRVPKEVAEKIKQLVDTGLYPNRSTLIREAIRRLVASEGEVTQKSTLARVAATLASVIIAWKEKTVTDVILFGSIARDKPSDESDVDILVLVENAESWVIRQHLYDLVYPIIPVLGVDISLIVIEKKHFIRMVRVGDPFALSVMKEGIQLHGDFLDEHGKGAFRKSL
jgi:Arc/MetJ-type ribon-helix-helix transcriptional regulator